MTIDEAIENLKYDNEIDMYIRDIAPQISGWLGELKMLRELKNEYRKIGYNQGYKKAIYDFSNLLCEHISESTTDVDECRDLIIDYARELRVGKYGIN